MAAMSGNTHFEGRLAEEGGVWQTEFLVSQSGRNRWRGFPRRKPGYPYVGGRVF